MRNIGQIAKREIGGYLRTPSGYLIAAGALLANGLLFNARALGDSARLSSQVLERYLLNASGVTTIAAVLLSMRLFAEERQSGTIVLLFTSPVKEAEIVIGKFLSALAALSALLVMSLYLPALIFVHGKVSIGHIAAGYAGLLLVGASTLALGLLASALARNQFVAGLLAAVFVLLLFLCWPLARVIDPPLGSLIAYFSLYEKHFFPFMHGLVQLSDIVYYLSVIYFALLVAMRALQSERWQ